MPQRSDKRNHNHGSQQVGKEHQEPQVDEELVYIGAQILAGNLDKDLNSFAEGYTEDNISGDGNQRQHKQSRRRQQDLGELRGRAVLGAFGFGGSNTKGGNNIKSNNLVQKGEKNESDWVDRADSILTSHVCPFICSDKEPIWKVLHQPIVSIAHVCIANSLVDRALHSDEANVKEWLYRTARKHLCMALELWSCNPSALLALANLTRMGVVVHGGDMDCFAVDDRNVESYDEKVRERMNLAMRQYMIAAKCASSLRSYGMEKIFGSSKLESADELFLVETIVLDLGAQVDVLDEEEEGEEEKEGEEKCGGTCNDNDNNTNAPLSPNDQYGQSKVVSTASYMAALLASTLGYHDLAKEALVAFGNGVTRIHPLVWDTAANLGEFHDDDHDGKEQLTSSTHNLATVGAFTPSIFREAIPEEMARILRYAFRPDAPYWDQSGYDRGVYYSFWHDYHDNTTKVGEEEAIAFSNVVEDVITTYLLPKVRTIVGEDKLSDLAGFEWWVHTRPHGANLGHQLHFDTDEALLEQDQIVSFPICATVLYLNAEHCGPDVSSQKFGATVLFDQSPYCKKNADRAWISTPKARSFLVFPGNLHKTRALTLVRLIPSTTYFGF
jgi:hypothetical protein